MCAIHGRPRDGIVTEATVKKCQPLPQEHIARILRVSVSLKTRRILVIKAVFENCAELELRYWRCVPTTATGKPGGNTVKMSETPRRKGPGPINWKHSPGRVKSSDAVLRASAANMTTTVSMPEWLEGVKEG